MRTLEPLKETNNEKPIDIFISNRRQKENAE